MTTPIQDGLALREAIRGAADATIGNTLGSFIAADPNNIPEGLRPFQAGYRRTCDIYAATGAIGQGLIGPALGAMCDPYLGADAPGYQDGSPGFTGGQCPFSYNLTFTVSGTNPFSGVPFTIPRSGQGLGPFNGISVTGVGGNEYNILIDWSGIDQTENILSDGAPSIGNIQLVPTSGGADNCGDPPPTGPDGYPPTRPGPPPPRDFPYNPTNGPTININVGSPSLRVDGTVNIPITVGGRQYDGNAGEPTGASGEPADGPDLENPGTPESPDPGEDEKDSDSPLVCAIIRTTTIDPGRGFLVLGDTERLYNPPLAYFRFKFQNGSSSAWTEVTHPDQLVCYSCCDVEADGYYVKWTYRCNGSVTPIRLKSQREE